MTKWAKRQTIGFAVVISLINFIPVHVNAWGKEGHHIVAMIASRHLSKKARAGIESLLDKDETLISVATYADDIRNARPDTRNFHFVDIPLAENDYDPTRDCKPTEEGDCVIAAIQRFRTQLADSKQSVGRRRFALKFLVHLIGDLHQPLHCADNNDRGGNDVKIIWFGRSGKGFNLHSVWDKLIIEQAGLDEAEFAEALEDGLTAEKIKALQAGTVKAWALEAHQAAQDHAYKIPSNGELGQKYYDDNFGVVDEQLLKGGLRLAKVLNLAFK